MTADSLDNVPESRLQWPWQAVVGVPIVLAVLILWGSPNFALQSGPEAEPFGGDFIQEWTGGWMLRHGDRARFYDPAYISEVEHDASLIGFEWDTDGYLPMVYPPFWYLLVSPLSLLPMTTGAVVWMLLMTVALAGAFWLLSQTRLDPHRASPFILAALLVYAPLIESLGSGQKGTLLLLLFAATFVLLDRKQLYWAGAVFGLVAFKPQLTLVVAFAMLFKRQWAFIAGGVTTGVVLVGLSFATGSEMCRQFFELCAGMGDYVQTDGYDLHKAHCWWGACQLMLDGAPDGVVKACAALGSLLTIGLLSVILRGPIKYGSADFARQFAAMTVATLLLSPHLLTYDLTLLLLPLLLLTCGAAAVARQWLWLPIALFVTAGQSAAIAAATGVQPSVLLMVGLLGMIAYVRRSAGAASSSPVHSVSATSLQRA